MAIVDLDKGTPRQARRGDRVLIAGLGSAILVFGVAIWLTAPHPAPVATAAPQSSAAAASAAPARIAPAAIPGAPLIGQRTLDPAARPLALPPGLESVDLFLVPERITNENLIWTMRSVVRIRGGVGLASIEGPAIVTWTEKGFQYWMVSPTRTTDELIKMADDLR
jgi:hypothetical protein